MIKNSLMNFIDSCVGNIARKIEDEFNESDHPRDKGGKFTSKGGEGRGGGKQEKSYSRKAPGDNVVTTSMEFTGDEEDAKQLAEKYGFDYKLTYPKGSPYATIKLTGDKNALREYAVNEGFGSEEDAKEFVPELFEEEDDDSVTGPEDRDYMNEEDDENSASKDVKSVRSAIDEELFELATTSESEEEFKSKVKHRFDQYRRLLKDDRTNELPVGGKRAEYALKKIQSEIDSGTSEYW